MSVSLCLCKRSGLLRDGVSSIIHYYYCYCYRGKKINLKDNCSEHIKGYGDLVLEH